MKIFQHGIWINIPDSEQERKASGIFQNEDGIWCVAIDDERFKNSMMVEEVDSGKMIYVSPEIETLYKEAIAKVMK